jgi:hypothetical protein
VADPSSYDFFPRIVSTPPLLSLFVDGEARAKQKRQRGDHTTPAPTFDPADRYQNRVEPRKLTAVRSSR